MNRTNHVYSFEHDVYVFQRFPHEKIRDAFRCPRSPVLYVWDLLVVAIFSGASNCVGLSLSGPRKYSFRPFANSLVERFALFI